MRRHLTLSLLLTTLLLTACGTRGPLTLPPPQSTAPAAVSAKTPPAPTPDANTAPAR